MIKFLYSQNLCKPSSDADLSISHLSMGIRLNRIGCCYDACKYFDRVNTSIVNSKNRDTLLVNKLLALRLSCQFDEAERFHQEIMSEYFEDLDDQVKMDIVWEDACRRSARTGSIKPILKLVKNMASLDESQILAAKMYFYAAGDKKIISSLPKMKTLYNKKLIGYSFAKRLKTVEVYELINDDLPRESGLKILCEHLESICSIELPEIELLSYLSSVHWLRKRGFAEFSNFILNEYHSLSFRLSKGLTKDVLGLISG
ncbi:MAG: hypothetical protein HQK54_08000 [Oligoflexales bacterium]|nr:hypothetical protein [Oligoflexales bacterium]